MTNAMNNAVATKKKADRRHFSDRGVGIARSSRCQANSGASKVKTIFVWRTNRLTIAVNAAPDEPSAEAGAQNGQIQR